VRTIFLSLFFLVSFSLGCGFYLFEKDWIDCSKLICETPSNPSVVLDCNGDELCRFALDKREQVSFGQMPKVLVEAFVAAEDHQFFKHSGVSIRGMLRAFFKNLYHMRYVQGAGTITQQLVRCMFLSNKRTLWRKLKEIFLAIQFERQFTKEQILSMYVNNVYYGRGIYGVEAASQRFWGKPAKEVNYTEAALLAAVAKSARYYSPLNAPEPAQRRRNVILYSMKKMGFLSPEEYEKGREAEMGVRDRVRGNGILLYIQETIRQWAEGIWGRELLYKGGLRIQSTIHARYQSNAETLFKKKIEELRGRMSDQVNGGMLAIEPSTGKIRVCIGGYDFRQSQFNRAFQAVRQIGSSFKPIVYTAALQQGIAFDSIEVDEPMEIDTGGNRLWKPRNWTHRFDGEMTLARALSCSNNIITIKTFLKVGAKPVLGLAKLFGYHRGLYPYPSLALGITEATVEENVAAFNVFANNGFYIKPHMVESVKNQWGERIWEYEDEPRRQVLDPRTNSQMVNLLSLRLKVLHRQLGKVYWPKEDLIGKTGSTNDAITTWYVGATPELTTGIYIGRDDSRPMGKRVFGMQTTFPVWFDFVKKLKGKKKHFYIDPRLKETTIDWWTGERSSDEDDINIITLLQ
jgi:penicillin-binding protein 1A